MPQISVIVPVYKVEPYLRRCVDSILAQTFTDFELILVDDGSPDNCGAICDEYAAKDPRVVVIHQENGGLSAARNAGIDWAFENSDSQWLTFIDSDDWIHLDYLQVLYNAVSENNTLIAMCDLVPTDGETIAVSDRGATGYKADAEWAYTERYGMCMTACCKLYSKNVMEDKRFPLGKLHEDAYLTHILLFEAKTVAVCDCVLYFYYTNMCSITKTPWSDRRLDEIDAHENRLSFLHDNGYKRAYVREVYAYVLAIVSQIDAIDRFDGVWNQSRNLLLGKLRKAIFEYHTIASIQISDNYHIYEVAFPMFMRCYWYVQAVLRKLHLRK